MGRGSMTRPTRGERKFEKLLRERKWKRNRLASAASRGKRTEETQWRALKSSIVEVSGWEPDADVVTGCVS